MKEASQTAPIQLGSMKVAAPCFLCVSLGGGGGGGLGRVAAPGGTGSLHKLEGMRPTKNLEKCVSRLEPKSQDIN